MEVEVEVAQELLELPVVLTAALVELDYNLELVGHLPTTLVVAVAMAMQEVITVAQVAQVVVVQAEYMAVQLLQQE
jgi:hypothetical protein